MRPPCEIVVKEVLPALRAILVRDLVRRHRLSQVEVARKLGVTQPAVSQYLSFLRGVGRVERVVGRAALKAVHELADDIARGKVRRGQIIQRYCAICRAMGGQKILCSLHIKSVPYLRKEGCRVCLGPRVSRSKVA